MTNHTPGVFQRHVKACTRPARCSCPWAFSVEVSKGGKRKHVGRSGFSSKRAAVAGRAEAIAQAKIGPVVDRRQSVAVAIDAWLERKVRDGMRPTTARSYRHHIDAYITPVLGSVRVADLSPEHLEHLLDEVRRMRPEMSSSTVSLIYTTMRSFVRTMYKRGRIAHDPTQRVEAIQTARPRVKVWQPDEAGRFLDWLDARGERMAAPIMLAMLTGLRRGEIAGLSWLDVDLDRAVLVVRQQVVQVGRKLITGAPKTAAGEHRKVDLDASIVAMLRRHVAAQEVERAAWGDDYADHGVVFAREDGSPLHPEALTRAVPNLVQQFNAELRVRRLDDDGLAALAAEMRGRRRAELDSHTTSRLSSVVRRAIKEPEYRDALRADTTLTGTPLPVVHFHSLRHLQASLMLAAGVPMAVVSKRLGHSTTTITADTYSHLIGTVGAEAASAAAALIPRTNSARFHTDPTHAD